MNIFSFYPSQYPQSYKYVAYCSLIALSVFLLLKLSVSTQYNRIPESIYSLCFIGVLFSRKWMILHDRGSQIFAFSVLVPFLLLLVNWLVDAASAVEYFSATQLIKLSYFVVIGFWLGGSLNRIYVFLSLAGIGLVAAIFQSDYMSEFERIFTGKRVYFGLSNAQHTAMYFGILLIGSISYVGVLVQRSLRNHVSWVLWASSGVFIGLSILVLIGAQTRAAWIGLIVVFVLFVILSLWRMNFKVMIAVVLLTVLLITMLSFFQNTIKKRVLREVSVVKTFINNGIKSVPYSSAGTRLHTWDVAIDKIMERPLIGFGARVRVSVIQESEELPNHIKKRFGHFHNSYIEFTLAYGLIGLAFLLYIFIWVNYRIYQISKKDNQYKPIWYFTFYGSIFMAVINCFESYVFFRSGVYTMSILLAPAYSLHLADIYKNKVNIQAQ